MILIVSNTGNWDHDMWGTVGVIDSIDDVNVWIKEHDNDLEHKTIQPIVAGEHACLESFEDNEVNFFCEGTAVAYVEVTEDHCCPDIYYLVKLK